MEGKTILDLRDSPWVDGPGRTILECAENIDKDRFKVIVGAFDNGKANGTPYEQESRRRGLDTAKIHEKRTFDLGALKQVIDLIHYHKVNIVHTHDFRSNIFGILAGKATNRPVVATVHGWIVNDFKAKIFTALDKLILRYFDHIIAVSEKTMNLLNKQSLKKGTIIHNALRIENYRINRPYGKFRKEFRLGENDVVIANIGRLSKEKGQQNIIKAAEAIRKINAQVRFILIGIGPDRQRLEELVFNKGLEKTVLFTGYRNDMSLIYNDFDLVVQTSLTEGMPNVVLESLLMEVPVIATDVGGTSEIIKDGKTGVLVPSNDLGVLTQKIDEFILNPIKYIAMAKQGRRDVMQRFNHKVRVEKLMEVYKSIIDSKNILNNLDIKLKL